MTITNQSLGHSQSFFSVDTKHLLSVLHVRYEELLVPIFVLVQQPSLVLKYPYFANPEAFALVLKGKTKESSGKLFALPSPIDGGKIITDAVPISIRLPSSYEVDACGSEEQNNARNSVVGTKVQVVDHLHQLSRDDRQRSWYISVRRRPITGHKDMFYVHLQSDIQFRSLVEVYCFIVDGKRPSAGHLKAVKEKLNKIDGGSKTIRGSSLIEKEEVGLYDHDNKYIYRWQTMPTKSQPGIPQNAETSGSKKRKREDDLSVQNELNSQTVESGTSEPKHHPLYDFLLKGI